MKNKLKRIYPKFVFEKQIIDKLEICSNHNILANNKNFIYNDFYFLENEDNNYDLLSVEELLQSKNKELVYQTLDIISGKIFYYNNILDKFRENKLDTEEKEYSIIFQKI
jgi:hypothetical protein